MSRYITEDDISVGYSSEPDEFESERVQDLVLGAEPFEIYVGNTGKVPYQKYFNLFKQHGIIKDMSFWRTHDHLYHARIVYRSKPEADKAIEQMNNRKFFTKRIRVTYAKERVSLDFPAAIRIDDISADVSEEDIFDHFLSCGDIRFVIKTGYAAYIQFASSASAAKALRLEMILNGDPYSLTRISADDRIPHIQVLENMKDIKYRKPYVMVENYPQLPPGTPLCRYKSNFESIGAVRHFKIAPTAVGTVTLALCMDKTDDRELVIDRFHDTVMNDKRLKLYMAPGKARMTVQHVAKYAICKNSITAENIPPYFKDYDVCMLFRKCGSISFLERFGSNWIICFDSPSAVSLARNYHIFSVYNKELKTDELNQNSFPFKKGIKLHDANATKPPEEEIKRPSKIRKSGKNDNFITQALNNMDKNIKQTMTNTGREPPPDVATNPKTLAHKAKQIDPAFNTKDNLMDVQTTPGQTKPSTLQPNKRPANDNGSNVPLARTRQDSSIDFNPETDDPDRLSFQFCRTLGNLPKGIEENDLRELFHGQEMLGVALYCSNDLYHPTSVAIISLTSKQDSMAIGRHHHDLYRGKRIGIYHTAETGWDFQPDNSLMLKNLPKNVSEEGIVKELEKVLGPSTVEDVLKPTHHYAYVDFKEGITSQNVLNRLRNALTRFKIDVFSLYQKLPKTWLNMRSHDRRKTIDQARSAFGSVLSEGVKDAVKEFGVHNAHKLFVGNIPRDTQAEDVIDYFNNFGSVIDYAPIEKKSCYLRKSAIMSFMNLKHAQNAYVQQPHYLEGCKLDVHLMDCPPLQFGTDPDVQLLTVKFHSPFLTNDEICHALQKVVNPSYNIRFDAFDDRANFVAKYRMGKGLEEHLPTLLEMQYINDEAVKIVQGYDPTPPKEDEARERKKISNSPFRQQKEKYLSFAIYTENLKDDMEVRSRPNKEVDVPFKSFYNDNSVQINNVSMDTSLEDIRDLFIKCGDIVDYRALLLEEDATKICYVKFKIDLAADLACTYSQRMVNGKRILVHLAKETLLAERDRSVLVEQLNPATTAEQLHDAFTPIGMVKYVQKQSPFSAIVCFKDKDSVLEAVNVMAIPNSGSFIISPCYEEHEPRLFNNFCCQEEFIPIERMRAALKPRVLPEFHQLELERQVFDTLPDDIKAHLINEVFLARQKLPNFNVLTKDQQINVLKTKYQDFPQKEHFLRLTIHEQEKLLEVTSNLQQHYPYEEVKDLEVLPPASKQTRIEEPVNKKPDKAFAVNWYSDPSQAPEQTIDMCTPGSRSHTVNASHVAQALPTSGLLGFSENNNPQKMEFPQPGNMFPQGGGSRFPDTYPQQGPPSFARGMPPFGGPNRAMMGPGPGPMMRPPMGMRPQMGGMPSTGPPNDRWMQQQMASMAYNAGPRQRGPMGFDGFFDRPQHFN